MYRTIGLYQHPQIAGMGAVATGYGGGSRSYGGPTREQEELSAEAQAEREEALKDILGTEAASVFFVDEPVEVTHNQYTTSSREGNSQPVASLFDPQDATMSSPVSAQAVMAAADAPEDIETPQVSEEEEIDEIEEYEQATNRWVFGVLAVAAIGGVAIYKMRKK